MAMQRKSNRSDRDNRDRDMTQGRKKCPLEAGEIIDLNDVDILRKFVTEYGKIIPARITGVTAAQQRQIKKGVRRARNMGLLA